MKIVAGSAKGKRLVTPAGNDLTRPTSEKVREAIFGSIQFEIADSTVLDLFAGSGAWGIEALSRGAKRAVLADSAREAIRMIRENLNTTGLAAKAEVISADFRKTLARLSGQQFHFIFLDPPYAAGLYQQAIEGILENGLLAEDGVIIAEHDRDTDLSVYGVYKQKRYGRTYVSFLTGGEQH